MMFSGCMFVSAMFKDRITLGHLGENFVALKYKSLIVSQHFKRAASGIIRHQAEYK